MPIEFKCSHCARPHNVADSHAGKLIKCKKCGKPTRVPARGPAKPSAPPAPPPPDKHDSGIAMEPPTPQSPVATPPEHHHVELETPNEPLPYPPQPPTPLAPAPIPVEPTTPIATPPAPTPEPPPPTPQPAPQPPTAKPSTLYFRSPYFIPIKSHITQTIGPVQAVLQETNAVGVHIDLLLIPPTHEPPSDAHPLGGNHFTIITAGMSSVPMMAPNSPGAGLLAELMICLPATWATLRPDTKLDIRLLNNEPQWWPLNWLKMIARHPSLANIVLNNGSVIPNQRTGLPFAPDTKLGCMLLLPSKLNPNARLLKINDRKSIHFFTLWPIYPEEMDLLVKGGVKSMMDLFAANGVTELLDINRRNLALP